MIQRFENDKLEGFKIKEPGTLERAHISFWRRS